MYRRIKSSPLKSDSNELKMIKKKSVILIIVLTAAFSTSYMTACGPANDRLVMTRLPAGNSVDLLDSITNKENLQNAQIISIDPSDPENSLRILTEGFISAISPELSYDYQKLVFAGKRVEGDNWQIWQLDRGNQKIIKLSDSSRNCFDPVFLPDQRIVFSCYEDESDKAGMIALYRADPDGKNINPVTFHPHANYLSTVLHDGRILFASEQVYPEKENAKLLALRPDGTNAGLFFELPEKYQIISKARENVSGQVFFSALNPQNIKKSAVFRFSYNDPFVSLDTLYSSATGTVHSVYPNSDDDMILSYRKSNSEPFGIYSFETDVGKPVPVYTDSNFHLLEPVIDGDKPFIPKKLPTALNFDLDTGIMVFVEADESLKYTEQTGRNMIQVFGTGGVIKEFQAADDGSFYIQASARMPIRYRLVDENGSVIRGPSPWFWVMPGERRGFTGWDEKQLITPANRVPDAINQKPVEISSPGSSVAVKSGDQNSDDEALYED